MQLEQWYDKSKFLKIFLDKLATELFSPRTPAPIETGATDRIELWQKQQDDELVKHRSAVAAIGFNKTGQHFLILPKALIRV